MKPVYVINGFLESGKTEFITFTLGQPYFQIKGKTLLILCEEGENEYEEELLKRSRTEVELIEDEEIILPESMTSNFTTASFTNDKSLERVVLPSSFKAAWLTNLNQYVQKPAGYDVNIVFTENSNIYIDEFGVVYDSSQQILYYAPTNLDLSEYKFPVGTDGLSKVMTISQYAFAYNSTLDSLVIPEGVTKIDRFSFMGSGLKRVVIPSSVTIIDNSAFNDSALEEVTFVDTKDLPSQITTFGTSVFAKTNLVSVVIPDKVETIGNNLFQYCYKLKSITTGASMKEIPNGLASYTPSLETLNMHEGIETICWIFNTNYGVGDYGDHQMTSIHIPASVKVIEVEAFCDMVNLKTVTFAEGSQLTTITKHAFLNCVSLESVTGIPASLETIGIKAFQNALSLKELDLSATAVTEIPEHVFAYTQNLKTFGIPAGLTSIGEYAFYESGIESFNAPATLTSLGVSAFENSDLKTVTFPTSSNLTSLGELVDEDDDPIVSNVFKGTTQLETVVLPNNLKTIADGAFANSSVKTVTMADKNAIPSLEYIGNSAFESCYNLEGFAYLESVTHIGEKAFFCCASLENTVVAEGLTSLGAMAFAFCGKLTEAYIPASLTELGGNPYAGIDKSLINLSANNKSFKLATDANGVTKLTDVEVCPTLKISCSHSSGAV